MTYAEKGNRVIEINESQIELYSSKGYVIKSEDGVVVKATPLTLEEALAKIDSLEKENAELKAKVDSATKPVEKAPTKKTTTTKTKE